MYEIKYRDESDLLMSDNTWFAEIASDWKFSKFKYISIMKTGNSINATDKDEKYSIRFIDYYNYIGTKDIDGNTNVINYENDLFIPRKNKFKIAQRNSSLICIEGGSAGRKLGYLNENVCYGNKLCNIVTNKYAVNKFIYYILQSRKFVEQINLKMTGIIPGISVEEFKNINLILPQIEEQQKIANFLDIKTAQFDLIISKKEQLIKKLEEAKKSLISEVVTGKVKIVDGKLIERDISEMKDSGVEWLGMIPKDWDVTKVKYYYDIQLGKMLQPIQKKKSDQYVKYLCTINTSWTGLKRDIIKSMWFSKVEMLKYTVKNNDLIVNEGGDAGKSCIVTNLEEPLYIQNAIHRVREKDELSNLYLHYWLYFLKAIQFVELICNKATIMHFTVDKFSNLELLKPVCSEMIEMIKSLDKSVLKINETVKKQMELINNLKQAKQSLISEAVTGKIDLRDWEITTEGELQ